ncbi:MAG: patatin-like phospholipase family protein [Saprospiraceae bacterium]|nr:patatin-like phospholipase family protein [Saprospiraceae bacterium]
MSKKVGLALSGGALRGIFHLGVLEALDEMEVPVDIFGGTSSGAIVAVLYANRHSPKEILKISTNGSLLKMFNLRSWSGGLLTLGYLEKILAENLNCKSIEDLDVPVIVTATNMLTGKVELFDSGDIVHIVKASSSIPIMFSPVSMNGQLYIDGGIVLNLPASPIRKHCDVLIGSNLVPDLEIDREDVSNLLKQAGRTFDLVVFNNIIPELEICDIEVTSKDLAGYGRFEFSRMSEMFDLGYEAMMGKKSELMNLL